MNEQVNEYTNNCHVRLWVSCPLRLRAKFCAHVNFPENGSVSFIIVSVGHVTPKVLKATGVEMGTGWVRLDDFPRMAPGKHFKQIKSELHAS